MTILFNIFIMGARLDGPSTGALLMEVSCSVWQQRWSGCDGVGLGRAMLCLLCWPAVRTTLILAAVSSSSSLSGLVSGICSFTVVAWCSYSSLHSGNGVLSSFDGCQSPVITTTTFVNKRVPSVIVCKKPQFNNNRVFNIIKYECGPYIMK